MLNVRDDHHGFGCVQFKRGRGVGFQVPVLLYQCNRITVATEGSSDPSLLNNHVWDICADPVCLSE